MFVTNLDTSTVYTFPIVTQLQWNVMVGMTPMPIPTFAMPLLLNFGGAQPTITINFMITSTNNSTGTAQGDYAILVSQFASNDSVTGSFCNSGYTLDLSSVIGTVGAGLPGFVSQLQISYTGGRINAFEVTMTFALGTIIG